MRFCNSTLSWAGSDLVSKSLRLKELSTLCTTSIPTATHSLKQWKHIKLCFFFNVNLAILTFLYRDLLSQNILDGSGTGIPNILNLYQSEIIISTAIWKATNSAPNVEDSTVVWRFKYQIMGTELQYKMIPVCEWSNNFNRRLVSDLSKLNFGMAAFYKKPSIRIFHSDTS